MLLNSLHVFLFFFVHIMCALATFIYSYIHTSCDVSWSTVSQKQSIEWAVFWLNERLLIVPSYSVFEMERTSLLLFCRGRKATLKQAYRSIDSQPNQHVHAGAGVTQEQKCLASSGGKKKTCFCGVTEYLNIKSVLYWQTHNAVCCIECFVLRKHSLADVGKIVRGKTPDFVSTANVRDDGTLIATECCWMNEPHRWSNFICHLCGSHIQLQTMFQLGQCLSSLHNCS